jgi:WD40 repeat protein
MQVQVWDGQAGVLMDSFRQHTADVLALAASADGSSVFAAGVDGKVICLQKVMMLRSLQHRKSSLMDANYIYRLRVLRRLR